MQQNAGIAGREGAGLEISCLRPRKRRRLLRSAGGRFESRATQTQHMRARRAAGCYLSLHFLSLPLAHQLPATAVNRYAPRRQCETNSFISPRPARQNGPEPLAHVGGSKTVPFRTSAPGFPSGQAAPGKSASA